MDRYYSILGVSENASPAELKAAFRKLAHRYHPDISREKNAKEKFIEVVEAYRALTGAAPHDTSEPFEKSRPTDDAQECSSAHTDAVSDCHIDAQISVEELYWGVELKINPSALCLGRRSEKNWRNAGLLKVKIPRGTHNGERLRVPAKKDSGKNKGSAGDIYITVKVKPHARYEIKGDDLYVDMPLSRWEAESGGLVDVVTPGGRIEVQVPAGIASGQSVRIPNHGLPRSHSEHGDLFAVARLVNIDKRVRNLHKWPNVPHADALRWRTVGGRHGNTIDVRV